MLPRVKINFADGTLGIAAPMDDGVAAFIAPVRSGLMSNAATEPFLVTSLESLENQGYDTSHAPEVHRTVELFYREAPKGSKLWVMPFVIDDANPGPNFLADAIPDAGHQLLEAARGQVRLLMADTIDISDPSLRPDDGSGNIRVPPAFQPLQELCEWATEELYAPCIAVTTLYARADIDCGGHPGLATDEQYYSFNRLCVVEGWQRVMDGGTPVADIVKPLGLLAGRLAAIPVQRSVARVKSGPIAGADVMWLPSCDADHQSPGPAERGGIAEMLHDMGYIVPRTFVGKTGYYWSDDTLLADPESDYGLIPRRRTIDKAYRIAYQTLVDEIGDEIAVTNDGRPAAPIVKAIETKVESAIVRHMTAQGNLGTDPSAPNDLGVQCSIDTDQNILANNRLDITLKVKPYGYAKYIEVTLGFLVEA